MPTDLVQITFYTTTNPTDEELEALLALVRAQLNTVTLPTGVYFREES